MGMFDKTESLTKQTDININEPFMLWGGNFLGKTVSREYGENVTATVKVGPADQGEDAAKTYNVYGVLAEMIQRMESGDTPCKVRVAQDGRAKIFVKVD